MMKRLILFIISLFLLSPLFAKDSVIIHSSDLHFLSHEIAEMDDHFLTIIKNADGKVTHLTAEITSAFVRDMIKLNPDCVILSGDLTLNGAFESHRDLIQTLQPLIDNGIPTLVLPGNHDTDSSAYIFRDGKTIETDSIESVDFPIMYEDFGYSNSIRDENSLSYLYKLSNKVWILALDTNANGTFCSVLPETLTWIEENLKKAKREGAEVISVTHQPMTIHNSRFTFGYTVHNSKEVLKLFNKYGVKLNLSGHLHLQHINKDTNFTDIAASSLAVFPNQYGIIKIKDNKLISYETKSVDVSSWAKENNIMVSSLLDFPSYSQTFFDDTTINKLKKQIEKKGLNSKETKQALDFATKLNREYFAGKVTATKNDKGWSIWENNLKDLSFYSYLNSILKDGVSDNTNVAF